MNGINVRDATVRTSSDFNAGTGFAIEVATNLQGWHFERESTSSFLMHADGDSAASGHERAVAQTHSKPGKATMQLPDFQGVPAGHRSGSGPLNRAPKRRHPSSMTFLIDIDGAKKHASKIALVARTHRFRSAFAKSRGRTKLALSKEIVMNAEKVIEEKVIELGKVSEETQGMEPGTFEGPDPSTALGA